MRRYLGAVVSAFRRGLHGLPRRTREREERASMAQVFTAIHKTNVWQNPESRSGPGSTVARTAELQKALAKLLEELRVETLIDAQCGDFNWMKVVRLPGIKYLGVDVVSALIEENQRRHADGMREFRRLDLAADPLPQWDLIFCRDCLVHFSHADVLRALANFKRSGSRYLLTTTFTARQKNDDIATGGWRPINLGQAPFHLPPPLRTISDGCPIPEYADKVLGLWRMEQVPG